MIDGSCLIFPGKVIIISRKWMVFRIHRPRTWRRQPETRLMISMMMLLILIGWILKVNWMRGSPGGPFLCTASTTGLLSVRQAPLPTSNLPTLEEMMRNESLRNNHRGNTKQKTLNHPKNTKYKPSTTVPASPVSGKPLYLSLTYLHSKRWCGTNHKWTTTEETQNKRRSATEEQQNTNNQPNEKHKT